jgi:hypothetical protein
MSATAQQPPGQGSNAAPTAATSDGTAFNGTCSATCNGTALIGPIDTAGTQYSEIYVSTTAAGSGTLTAQTSPDNANWTSVNCYQDALTYPPAFVPTNITFVGAQVCPLNGNRYFRIQFTAYASGTFTAIAYGRTIPGGGLYRVVGQVGWSSYPTNITALSGAPNAIPITGTATGTTASIAVTLAAAVNKFTYLCGFVLSADATASTEGAATITGAGSGTMNFRQSVAALANGTAQTPQTFTPCLQSSAVNTAITINSVAAGTGGNAAGYAWGYQL